MKFPRNARIFRGQLDASPFVGVLFLVAIFLLFNSSLVFFPGVPIHLPEAADLPGVTGPTVAVAVDNERHFYYRDQIIQEAELQTQLRKATQETREPLTVVMLADKSVPNETLMRLCEVARKAGVNQVLLASRPPAPLVRTNASR